MPRTIVEVETSSSAPPAAFFDLWADMTSWPEWNTDTEWVRLDGPFAEGVTGSLKPKRAPKVKFVVERLVPNREFVDVSRLTGARLSFAHTVTERSDGGSLVQVTVTLSGPLSGLWARVLGKGLISSAQTDLDALARVAEGNRPKP